MTYKEISVTVRNGRVVRGKLKFPPYIRLSLSGESVCFFEKNKRKIVLIQCQKESIGTNLFQIIIDFGPNSMQKFAVI